MISRTIRRSMVAVAVLASAALWSMAAGAQELGTITFPTSGAAAAQPAFLEGVKALHSFQFDEAAVAFRSARQTDPDFALAYWGEAMSYNHPLWAQQDTEAARRVLETLAPTLDQRRAKAGLTKERAFLEAADRLFYGPADKLARDRAYSDYMAQMYEQWPDDHEVATFYALSLLGTVRPGDTGSRRQALAASIAMKVWEENPNHPGAAHFIIHSFDDPDHAPLGLPAALAYADIAPSAAHALHMPSHIFVQLGMWADVVKSNIEAYAAAVEVNKRLHLAEGREDFHTLSWLSYANLMLGKLDDARANVELARQAAERNPDNNGIRDGYLGMRARYILETEQWERIPIQGGGEHTAHDSMPGMAQSGGSTWLFIAGFSAAKLGDLATADAVEAELKNMREKIAAEGNAYRAKSIAILENEVAALTRLARNQQDAAIRLAKEAADIELTLAAPSGPPEPIKPAPELYGEILLAADRPTDAMAAFQQSLLRMPKRTPSLVGLARAAVKAGNAETARRSYTEVIEMAGAAPSSPAVQEARRWLSSNSP
ncbi:MAG TPA: tetratricopeptide repeat protein [Gammaproteobacteria bacterium]|nr:tetratricopeptide repeat protein [Gammaproteobacteria bacterium]